jgi:energy-coupling factor transporter ATP-binding protein EcfA2
MVTKEWLHKTIKKLHGLGCNAEAAPDGMTIRLGKSILLPSQDGESYSLAYPLGRVESRALPQLISMESGSLPYAVIVLNSRHGQWIETGIRIGEFPCDSIERIESHLDYLDRLTVLARSELDEFLAPPVLDEIPDNSEILVPSQPYVRGGNHERLEAFLRVECNAPHGGRLMVIGGQRGLGKKTTLSHVLNDLGFIGLKLQEEGGKAAGTLCEEYRSLTSAMDRMSSQVVLVITDIIGDSFLTRRDSAYDLLLSQLRTISMRCAITVLTSAARAEIAEAGSLFLFQQESPDVLQSILTAHYPGECPHYASFSTSSVLANAGDIAEPLNSLRRAASGNVQNSESRSPISLPRHAIIESIRRDVVGHEKEIAAMVDLIKSYEDVPGSVGKGMANPTILVVGPSGTGKTWLGKCLAGALNVNYVLLACNESVNEEFFMSKFQGSGPGYVAYSDHVAADDIVPGCRSEKRWGTVIIIDEVQLARPRTREHFLSWMQEASIRLAKRTINLENNILYFTANIRSEASEKQVGGRTRNPKERSLEPLLLSDGFEESFLSRINLLVEFKAVRDDHVRKVIASRSARLAEEMGIIVHLNAEEVAQCLAGRYSQRISMLGLRTVDSIIRQEIIAPLSRLKEEGCTEVLIRTERNAVIVESLGDAREETDTPSGTALGNLLKADFARKCPG